MEREGEGRIEGEKWDCSIITKDEKYRFWVDKVAFAKIWWDNESSKRISSEYYSKEWVELLSFFFPRCSCRRIIEKKRGGIREEAEGTIIFWKKESVWRGSEIQP